MQPSTSIRADQAGFRYLREGQQVKFEASPCRLVIRAARGSGIFVVGGEKHAFAQDSWMVSPWNTSVQCIAPVDRPVLLCYCRVVSDMPNGEDLMPELPKLQIGFLSTNHVAKNLFDYFLRTFDESMPDWRRRYLAQLLIDELRRYFSQGEAYKGQTSMTMQQAMQFLDENIDRAVSTRDLAEHLNCSPSTLTRYFRKHLDQTPTQWINEHKITYACHLLVSSRFNIGEIGRMAGVEDPYYFSKLFRRVKGMTPTEYRERHSFF